MAKIINLEDKKLKKTKFNPDDNLEEYLKKAILLKKFFPKLNSTVAVMDIKKFKLLLLNKISELLIKNKYLEKEFFICGNYISTLIINTTTDIPESWFAIDFIFKTLKTKSPFYTQKGADICFLICAIFRERGNIRSMKISDYQKMGMGLYRQFYFQTNKEIGLYMSNFYGEMADVTNECFYNLKQKLHI